MLRAAQAYPRLRELMPYCTVSQQNENELLSRVQACPQLQTLDCSGASAGMASKVLQAAASAGTNARSWRSAVDARALHRLAADDAVSHSAPRL